MTVSSTNASKLPRKRRRAPPSPNAFAYTFVDALAMGGPDRAKSYELMKSGRLQLLKVDGRRWTRLPRRIPRTDTHRRQTRHCILRLPWRSAQHSWAADRSYSASLEF